MVIPEVIDNMGKVLDTGGMLSVALSLHQQIRHVLSQCRSWKFPDFKPRNVLIAGLGGSSIGGDLINTLMEDEIRVPVLLCRDYNVPGFVDEDTLCLCVSYSGNTEETLSAYRQCRQRNAKVLVVSTGGKLKEYALQNGDYFYPLKEGYQPRAALGLSFTTQLMILSGMGLIRDYADELESSARLVESLAEKWQGWNLPEDNPPLYLALDIRGSVPVIYGSMGYLKSMAYRWKCQFNENSKMYANWGVFPEINHNEIVGWRKDRQFCANKYAIFLREQNESRQIRTRVELTGRVISEMAPVCDVFAEGENDLEKLFYFILFGDLLTIYLAFLNGKDPSDIQVINWFKKELGEMNVESATGTA